MARKHGCTVYATISVIRDDDDIEVEVSGYYEPEQNGGMTDPSWSAYVTFEGAEFEGKLFILSAEETYHAEQVMLEKA